MPVLSSRGSEPIGALDAGVLAVSGSAVEHGSIVAAESEGFIEVSCMCCCSSDVLGSWLLSAMLPC